MDWPCNVWLQKKLVWPTNKAALGVCYQLLCTNLGDGILCALSPNHNIHRENGVYQGWTICALKSKFQKCIFQRSGDPNLLT